MTTEEAIEILEEVKELDDTMYAYNPVYMNALDIAISALKEVQLYKDNKLCLVPEDVYSRQCSELDTYKEIGTVEECREAVEKQKAKNPVKDKYHHNCCPNCGWIVSGEGGYGEEFCPHCENCGQVIRWVNENLEGMEDERD